MNWYIRVISNYVGFSGRARRTEYWMFVLFNCIISIVLSILSVILHMGKILPDLYALAVFLPYLAVSVRRLHDIGRSGWWLLLGLIPIVGGIILLVWSCLDSETGDNFYGPYPKG